MYCLNTVFVLLVVLFATFNASAQQGNTGSVPNLVRFSGKLVLNETQLPGSMTVGVTFAIYKQQDGGAPVWMETQNVTPDGGGHYSVLLGSTRAEGLPSDLFSVREERWLGVQVQGQSEQPRVLLVSVPYAMKAAEADRLAGHSVSEFVTTDDLQSAVQQQLQRQSNALAQTRSAGVTVSANQPPSSPYIDNGTALQVGSNFNIDGTGSADTFNATSLFTLSGTRFLGNSGVQGLFLGAGAGQSNNGSFNTFLGVSAGQANTTANYNTFVGYAAGKSNTTGTPVTFVGMNAGYHNTTGNQNFFLGVNAGYYNTTGSNNVFIGNQSGYNSTTGRRNTFVGNSAGSTITIGADNIFLGNYAGSAAGATASNNIYLANVGAATDNGVIRIGDPANQTTAYIAGVSGVSTSSGMPIFIDSNGKLGTGGGSVNFSQMTGAVTSPQLTGTYSNPVVLSNASNAMAGAFDGTFTGDGAGLTGVMSGLSWPVITKSADYAIQFSDFATPTTHGNYVVLTGAVSRTFTLPNPPPPNGYCVAIGNVADAGINSATNVFLSVNPNGMLVDNGVTSPTMPRRTAYLYCSDGSAGYYRLGYQQNGVSQIGPWLETLDTGVVNAYKTTFRNGMDFGLANGSMIFLLVKAANTTSLPTLDVNGLGPKKILKYGNQALAPGDLSSTAYALLIYDGQFWELINPQTTRSTITGTTGSIGGTLLAAGTCTNGTAAVTGAAVGHPVSVSASNGSLPNGMIVLSAAVTSANVVTVQLCAIADVTPPANTYNVATQ